MASSADGAQADAVGGSWLLSGRDNRAGCHQMEPPPISSSSSSWVDTEDLAELFSRLGLGKYTDIFQQQEIDLVTFLTLTEQDLKELGISTFGARRKMLNAITDINKRQTLLQVVPRLPNTFRDIGHTTHRRDLASQSGRW
jgi:protein bicaudal C